jgi:hypothetical protein
VDLTSGLRKNGERVVSRLSAEAYLATLIDVLAGYQVYMSMHVIYHLRVHIACEIDSQCSMSQTSSEPEASLPAISWNNAAISTTIISTCAPKLVAIFIDEFLTLLTVIRSCQLCQYILFI